MEDEILKGQLAMLREIRELEDKNKWLGENLNEAKRLLNKAMKLLGNVDDLEFTAKLISLRYQVSLIK